jgi:hypothetical protein
METIRKTDDNIYLCGNALQNNYAWVYKGKIPLRKGDGQIDP